MQGIDVVRHGLQSHSSLLIPIHKEEIADSGTTLPASPSRKLVFTQDEVARSHRQPRASYTSCKVVHTPLHIPQAR
jgi:hypothetical protein